MVKLIENFKEQVPATIDFDIGYYNGNQKAWLDDLNTMYARFKSGGTVTLWCDARVVEKGEETQSRRKQDSARPERHQEKEDEVECTYKQLLEKHGKKFGTPNLSLWSRMISSGLHDDYHAP